MPASKAVEYCSFALREVIRRVNGKAPGITNAWVNG